MKVFRIERFLKPPPPLQWQSRNIRPGVLFCAIVIFTSLTNSILCNTNVNDNSENPHIRYGNESSSAFGGGYNEQLLEDSPDAMVWSHVLEDYVLR